MNINKELLNKSDIESLLEPVLLWENPNPDSSFTSTGSSNPITVPNINNFKYLILGYKYWYDSNQSIFYIKIKNNRFGTFVGTAVSSNEQLVLQREFEFTSNTSLYFKDCYSNQQVDNQRLIPIVIYGTNIL